MTYDLCAIISEGWGNTVLGSLLDEHLILDRVFLIPVFVLGFESFRATTEHGICYWDVKKMKVDFTVLTSSS